MRALRTLAAVVLAAAACTMPAGAADPYVIPAILPLTGSGAELGTREAAALRAFAAMANAAGGVRGRPVQFDVRDDASLPATAAQLAQTFAADHAAVLLGPALGPTCAAVAPVADTGGPTTYCLAPSFVAGDGGSTFAAAPAIDDVVPAIFRYLQARKSVRVAVVATNDATGAALDARVDAALAAPEFRNVTLVAREQVAPDAADLSAPLARISAAAPDVLLTFAVGAPFDALLRAVRYARLDVPVIAAGGNMTYDTMRREAAWLPSELILNGVRGIAADPLASAGQKRAQTAFASALAAAGLRPEFATAIPWDPASIVLEAVRRAGPDASAAQIRTAIDGLRFTGIAGTYAFSPADMRGIGAAANGLFRYDQATNAFVQVYPAPAQRSER